MKTNYTEKWAAQVSRLRDDVLRAQVDGRDYKLLLDELTKLAPNIAAKLTVKSATR
jgi:hypothetical protein